MRVRGRYLCVSRIHPRRPGSRPVRRRLLPYADTHRFCTGKPCSCTLAHVEYMLSY